MLKEYFVGTIHNCGRKEPFSESIAYAIAKQTAVREGIDSYIWELSTVDGKKTDKAVYFFAAYTGIGHEYPNEQVKYQRNIYNIGYKGVAIRLDSIERDPDGDGSGRGSGSVWVTEYEFNDLVEKGKISIKRKPDSAIRVIPNVSGGYSAYYEKEESTYSSGATPEDAVKNLNNMYF